MKNDVLASPQRHQLINDGFCIFENVLHEKLLTQLREVTDRLIDAQSEEDVKRQRSTGSMISVYDDPLFADLITAPRSLAALAALGFDQPKFTSGFIISKPPHSPRLFWHYDWAGWDDPGSFGPVPQQLFLMYYLVDTSPANGCLRVIPSTHRHHNPLLDELQEAHSAELREARNLNLPEFSTRPDEVNITVKAGDVVIGDSRLLHAAHANETDQRRTVITLWYHPDMNSMHESTQAFIAKMSRPAPAWWPAHQQELFEPMRASYTGTAEPLPWNRIRPHGR